MRLPTRRLALIAAGRLRPAGARHRRRPPRPRNRSPPLPATASPISNPCRKENGSISGFGGDWSLTSFAAAGVARRRRQENGKIDRCAHLVSRRSSGRRPGREGKPSGDRIRAGGAALLRGRDRSGPSLQTPEPDRQSRLLLPTRQPRVLRLANRSTATVFGLLALADTKTTPASSECRRWSSTSRSTRSKPTSTPTAAGPGTKPPATKRR